VRTNFYITCGSLQLTGSICGDLYLESYCGSPSAYLNNGLLVNNLTALYGSILQGNGNVNVNILSLSDVTIYSVQITVLKMIIGIYNPSIYLQNANLSISSGLRFDQGPYTISINGDSGLVINNGIWVCTSYLYIGVPIAGTGQWILNGTVSLTTSGVVNTPIILQSGANLVIDGLNTIINNITGVDHSYVYFYGATITINHITVGTITDNVSGGFTLNNFDIKSYGGGGNGDKTFVKGTVGNFIGGSYTTLYIKPQVKILQGFSITMGDILNSEIGVPLGSFSFIGGYLNQTVNNGVFQVSGTTTFTSGYTKSFGPTTRLQTANLVCQCPSPDCGIPLSDWNHVQAGQTSGCII